MKRRSTTTELALANIRTNKTRSVLIGISVMLTTMLLTVIALTGYGMIKDNRVNAGVRYGEYHGAFVQVKPEVYGEMRIHSAFYDVGRSETFGSVELEKADGVLSYMDDTAIEVSYTEASEGALPVKEQEIAGQKGFFEKAGYPDARPGDAIRLSYRIGDGKIVNGEFVISGFLRETEANELKSAYGAMVSQEFYEKNVPQSQQRYTVCFKVKGADKLNEYQMEEKIYDLAEELGIEKNHVAVNNGYLLWTLDPGLETIAVCCAVAALVILFSVLVIYNIYYVGIIQKVQEYGKLRAIGATKKQIRQALKKEGMIVAIISVALGAGSGILISNFFFQWLLRRIYESISMENVQTVAVFNVPLILLAAALALGTVYISLLKPARVAAGISPVEAIRYQEGSVKGKGIRKGYRSMNVRKLTLSNLAGNKKRTVITILTMGLSCVLFVVVSNVAGNMDPGNEARRQVEKGDFHITLDAASNDNAYPENNLNHVQQLGLMGPEWQKELCSIEGVTDVEARKSIRVRREQNEGDDESTYVLADVYSREDYEKLECEEGIIDYDSASRNQEILFGFHYFMEDYGYEVGDKVKLVFYDGDREIPMEYTITGSTEKNAVFILTEDQFDALGVTEDMTADVWVSCEKGKLSEVESSLEQMTEESPYYELETYENAYKVSAMSVNLVRGGAYGLLGIIGVIGFMNMANTLITSIITRKRELGILQAIGMTRKQLNKMLQMEGMIFTIGTLLVALTLGNGLGYLAFLKCREEHVLGLSVYHIPWIELVGMTLFLLLLQMLLSSYMSKSLQKDALIERIRHQG